MTKPKRFSANKFFYALASASAVLSSIGITLSYWAGINHATKEISNIVPIGEWVQLSKNAALEEAVTKLKNETPYLDDINYLTSVNDVHVLGISGETLSPVTNPKVGDVVAFMNDGGKIYFALVINSNGTSENFTSIETLLARNLNTSENGIQLYEYRQNATAHQSSRSYNRATAPLSYDGNKYLSNINNNTSTPERNRSDNAWFEELNTTLDYVVQAYPAGYTVRYNNQYYYSLQDVDATVLPGTDSSSWLNLHQLDIETVITEWRNVNYSKNAIVKHFDTYWFAKFEYTSASEEPGISNAWQEIEVYGDMLKSIEYIPGTVYAMNRLVRYQGSYYVAVDNWQGPTEYPGTNDDRWRYVPSFEESKEPVQWQNRVYNSVTTPEFVIHDDEIYWHTAYIHKGSIPGQHHDWKKVKPYEAARQIPKYEPYQTYSRYTDDPNQPQYYNTNPMVMYYDNGDEREYYGVNSWHITTDGRAPSGYDNAQFEKILPWNPNTNYNSNEYPRFAYIDNEDGTRSFYLSQVQQGNINILPGTSNLWKQVQNGVYEKYVTTTKQVDGKKVNEVWEKLPNEPTIIAPSLNHPSIWKKVNIASQFTHIYTVDNGAYTFWKSTGANIDTEIFTTQNWERLEKNVKEPYAFTTLGSKKLLWRNELVQEGNPNPPHNDPQSGWTLMSDVTADDNVFYFVDEKYPSGISVVARYPHTSTTQFSQLFPAHIGGVNNGKLKNHWVSTDFYTPGDVVVNGIDVLGQYRYFQLKQGISLRDSVGREPSTRNGRDTWEPVIYY